MSHIYHLVVPALAAIALGTALIAAARRNAAPRLVPVPVPVKKRRRPY